MNKWFLTEYPISLHGQVKTAHLVTQWAALRKFIQLPLIRVLLYFFYELVVDETLGVSGLPVPHPAT